MFENLNNICANCGKRKGDHHYVEGMIVCGYYIETLDGIEKEPSANKGGD